MLNAINNNSFDSINIYGSFSAFSSVNSNGNSMLQTEGKARVAMSRPPVYDSAGRAVLTQEIVMMRVSFSSLTVSSRSVFDKTTAVSSDTDLLQIKSGEGRAQSDITVLIDQIAAAQINNGEFLNINANPAMRKDSAAVFEIDIDGVKHQISVDTDGKETNKSLQEKMADAINKVGIGITASVILDKDEKNSSLRLESGETGKQFTVTDVIGDAVVKMGIGNVVQNAQEAIFSINGGEKQTSKSNDVDLGNGLTAKLVKESDKPVTISLKKDTGAVESAMFGMVKSINNVFVAAGTFYGNNTSALVSNLSMTVTSSIHVLKDIGVNQSNSGLLEVDVAKMKEAAENGSVERFFRGDAKTLPIGSDFVSYIQKILDGLTKDFFNLTNFQNSLLDVKI